MPKNSPFATCLICGAADAQLITANQSFGINVFQCKSCGFVQSEFVSDRSLELYYANFYRGPLNERELAELRQKGAEQASSQIAYLREQQPGLKVSAALDYGTAEGSLGHQLCAVADRVFVTE